MEKLNIVLVAGTTRESRMTIHAANLVREVGESIDGIEINFVDLKEFFPLPGEGNDKSSQNQNWVDINKKSDAYFIVAPEYNHGYPGSLKMLLDNDLKNYNHKPVVVAGVSSGMIGGARMIENLSVVLRELGMIVSHADVHFPKVQEMFDDKGKLLPEMSKQKERIQKSYKELVWLAKTLKWGRENL